MQFFGNLSLRHGIFSVQSITHDDDLFFSSGRQTVGKAFCPFDILGVDNIIHRMIVGRQHFTNGQRVSFCIGFNGIIQRKLLTSPVFGAKLH